MAKKGLGSPQIAKERQKRGVEEIKNILIEKGMSSSVALSTAKEVMAAGFCIVGGGVPV